MSNKFRLILASLGLLALVAAAPALAQTSTNTNPPPHGGYGNFRGFGGPGMGNGVFGTVASVSGNTLTVTSKGRPASGSTTPTTTTYTVDATNATVMKNGATSSVSDIAVGDMVSVQGTVSGTNVTATKINDGMMGMRPPGFFGTVATVSGNTLTVTSKGRPTSGSKTPTTITYTVDATNATVTKAGAASTVSAIAVGDMVMVQGTVTGTNVTATKINDGIMMGQKGGNTNPLITGNGEPVIAGSVSAISGNTLTVTNKSNVTYSVDATNATVTKSNAKSTVSAIAVGDNVVIQGTVNGTNVTASSVIDSGAPKTSASTNQGHISFFGSIGNFFKKIFGF